MARLQFGGFEAQHYHADGLVLNAGSIAIDTTTKRSGAAAGKCGAAANNQFSILWTATQGRTYYVRIWFRFGSNPPSDINFAFTRSSGTSLDAVVLTSTGRLKVSTGSSAVLATNTWHCMELSLLGTGSTKTMVLRVNGTDVATVSNSSTANPNEVRLGNVGPDPDWPDVWFDDWALNDDQGTADNTWAGTTEKVILLKPTSDNAVGGDWKLGTGTTPSANAYDAIDNTPPLGVADGTAGSDTKQVRDNVASTAEPGSDLDVNLQSYTAAGMGAGDTVNSVLLVGEFGNDSAASTRSGALKFVSNPSSSEASFTVPAAAAGTYPTGWNRFDNGVIAAPTVTLATSPVARIGKRAADSNSLLCSFLGAYVAYNPAPPAQTVSPTGIASAQALGTAQVNQRASPAGITSGEASGTATVTPGAVTVSPSGVASLQAFGTPTVTAAGQVAPAGIPSAQAIGVAQVNQRLDVAAIVSGAALGTPAIAVMVAAGGIASGEQFGSGYVEGPPQTAVVVPILVATLFGYPVVTTGPTIIHPLAIGTEVFGTPRVFAAAGPGKPAHPKPRNLLYDPLTGDWYEWTINHTSEDPFGPQRTLEYGALSSTLGLVRQQKPNGLSLRLQGTILTDEQKQTFDDFYARNASRVLGFEDYTGAQYVVVIVSYDAHREMVALHPRIPGRRYIWRYALELDVIRVLAGEMAAAGVVA